MYLLGHSSALKDTPRKGNVPLWSVATPRIERNNAMLNMKVILAFAAVAYGGFKMSNHLANAPIPATEDVQADDQAKAREAAEKFARTNPGARAYTDNLRRTKDAANNVWGDQGKNSNPSSASASTTSSTQGKGSTLDTHSLVGEKRYAEIDAKNKAAREAEKNRLLAAQNSRRIVTAPTPLPLRRMW